MRYQSFYPFSQQQSPPIPPQYQPPRNSFLRGLSQSFGAGNMGGPQIPNPFSGGGPSQSPFGMGNAGTPQVANRMEYYLQTADQFLSTAQRLTPMVQQVAPMVQNIPALWKIYRGFQSMPNVTTAASAVSRSAGAAAATSVARTTGSSIPRIFQPPL
ncbi:MAG TPA: VrrA/YqfQ family protein [Paenisporosarcina sp.]|nr:VrrA/YqfQ family protein [Paenisporosarcina sp.]